MISFFIVLAYFIFVYCTCRGGSLVDQDPTPAAQFNAPTAASVVPRTKPLRVQNSGNGPTRKFRKPRINVFDKRKGLGAGPETTKGPPIHWTTYQGENGRQSEYPTGRAQESRIRKFPSPKLFFTGPEILSKPSGPKKRNSNGHGIPKRPREQPFRSGETMLSPPKRMMFGPEILPDPMDRSVTPQNKSKLPLQERLM